MLREVSMEEISDGKLYSANDMVKADCQDCRGCSDCCRGMGDSIILDPYDAWRLTTGLQKSFGELVGAHLDLHVVDGVILPNLKMGEATGGCTFLNEAGRCSIHAHRPGICRLFPLGRYYDEERKLWYFLQTGECSKTNRSKIKVKKWIDTPDFSRNEKFVLRWHYFVMDLQKILMQQPDMEKARKINLYVLQMFFFQGWDAEADFYEQFEARLVQALAVLKQLA